MAELGGGEKVLRNPKKTPKKNKKNAKKGSRGKSKRKFGSYVPRKKDQKKIVPG